MVQVSIIILNTNKNVLEQSSEYLDSNPTNYSTSYEVILVEPNLTTKNNNELVCKNLSEAVEKAKGEKIAIYNNAHLSYLYYLTDALTKIEHHSNVVCAIIPRFLHVNVNSLVKRNLFKQISPEVKKSILVMKKEHIERFHEETLNKITSNLYLAKILYESGVKVDYIESNTHMLVKIGARAFFNIVDYIFSISEFVLNKFKSRVPILLFTKSERGKKDMVFIIKVLNLLTIQHYIIAKVLFLDF